MSRFYFTTAHTPPYNLIKHTDKQVVRLKENEILAEYDEDGDMIIPRFENNVEQNVVTIGKYNSNVHAPKKTKRQGVKRKRQPKEVNAS